MSNDVQQALNVLFHRRVHVPEGAARDEFVADLRTVSAEIESLRQQLTAAREREGKLQQEVDQVRKDHMADLVKGIGDAQDAARYRWLRARVGVSMHTGSGNPWLPCGNTKVDPLETDAAIDAALSHEQAQQEAGRE